jgi:hypothetical protein
MKKFKTALQEDGLSEADCVLLNVIEDDKDDAVAEFDYKADVTAAPNASNDKK